MFKNFYSLFRECAECNFLHRKKCRRYTQGLTKPQTSTTSVGKIVHTSIPMHTCHPELVSGSLKHTAFSLVEMLMALLVASLLLVALAPVVTKRFDNGLSVNGIGGGSVDVGEKSLTINYNDPTYCNTPDEENNACRGEFKVPEKFAGTMYVTVLGAGGGGAASASTGTVEYKTEGDHAFTVPLGVDEITVTVISGGQGGYAGTGTDTPKTFTTPEVSKWNSAPAALKGRYVAVWGCGGGGGSGSGGSPVSNYGGAGGAGGFRKTPAGVLISDTSNITYQVGGAGGGAASGGSGVGRAGTCGGGGDGGFDDGCKGSSHPTCADGHDYGGKGGAGGKSCAKLSTGGSSGGGAAGGNGNFVVGSTTSVAEGGSGNGGGKGGTGSALVKCSNCYTTSGAGGGKYGGGGGGGGPHACGGGGGGPTYFNGELIASGGGGGGGGAYYHSADLHYGAGGGGGGGGSNGGQGGAGGNVTATVKHGVSGQGGWPGQLDATTDGSSHWTQAKVGNEAWAMYGTSHCAGGAPITDGQEGKDGKSGMIKINYLNYSSGGKGGGTGKTVTQTVKVVPGETLKVTVGAGGEGGKSLYINSSASTTAAVNPQAGSASIVARKLNATTYTTLVTSGTSNTSGGGAANGLKGGNGAKISGMGCTAGVGGDTDIRNDATSPSDATLNAKNYGGCGGGGGYALSRGGNGSFGYVKITWNPNKKITGGGGGSGNSLDTTILDVKPNTKIPFQIGRGGAGGSIDAGVVVEAQKGGDTIFGTGTTLGTKQRVTAGGGFGGKFPVYNTSTKLMQNGLGGGMASLCKVGLKSMLICTSAINGDSGTNSKGGNGAESYLGKGGDGGSFNLNGSAAEALGAGGGGAGVYNAGTSVTIGSETTNAIKGGNGGNGQIKLRWFEKTEEGE